MIKNNKGVTLVELLIVIVVMGIIAAFAIPAVGTIIENTNRDAVLNDAFQVENAARLYCVSNTCADGVVLTDTQLAPFIEGITWADYVIDESVDIATDTSSGWEVLLEAAGTPAVVGEGPWEFTQANTVPSASTTSRADITRD